MNNFLYAKYNCLVEINGKGFPILSNELLPFEDCDFIKIFPMKDNFLPFCFKGEDFEISKHITHTKFPNYNLIEIKAPRIFVGEYFNTKKFKDGNITIVGEPYTIMCTINEKNYSFFIEDSIKLNSISEVKNCIIFDYLKNNEHFLLIFHKKTHFFKEFNGNYEIIENEIKILEDRHTLARHGILHILKLNENELLEVSTETVYINQSPKLCPYFLFHIAFFEAVREKDYNLAKTYLTEEFSKKITPSHFKQFFGDFDIIKPIKENNITKIALIKKESSIFYNAKVYNISFKNNLICDISVEE